MGKKESGFVKARDNYTFRQSVVMQTINDDNGKPDGEYRQVTDIGFDKSGKRNETVVFAPQNTLETRHPGCLRSGRRGQAHPPGADHGGPAQL